MAVVKPYFYKQTDSRWASYSWRGMTIGGGGCGPTSIANAASALVKKVSPKTVFKWLCKNGYILPGAGTYWSGITAGLKHYGVDKFTVTSDTNKAKACLKKGQWVLTVVGPSRWTSGGHYILIYKLKSNGKLSISDPYSYSNYCQEDAPFSDYARAEKNSWICIDPKDYPKSGGKIKKSKTFLRYTQKANNNIRKGRGTKYGVKAVLKRGVKLILHDYKNGWYRIKAGKYKGYYIHKNNLSTTRKYVHTYQTLRKMNVRAGYTNSAKIIRTVKKGTKLVSSKQMGRWRYFPAVKGWIKRVSSDDKTLYLKKIK